MKEESVKVLLRIRPLSQRELSKNGLSILETDLKENQVTLKKQCEEEKQAKLFCFDDVLAQSETQAQVFQSAALNLINKVVEGYNGTIFAYGQTGSGKTYTMVGNMKSEESMGIIPRSFQRIIDLIQSSENKNFLIRCSFIEIYNQEIHDLLSPNIKTKLEIRESYERGVFIKDLTKHIVKSLPEMLKLLSLGNSNRSVAETLMNQESSRSHAIFTIYIESSEMIQGQQRFRASKFNLVDLAGSQRQSRSGSTGQRLKQASKINLSLSALGNVISALVSGKGNHIPYRDSKLTRLLQDSLGGNTKTIMIANVSPCNSNYDETLSTLRYASRAKYIQNAPIINEDPKDALLRQYEDEIKKLRGMLEGHKQNAPSRADSLKGEKEVVEKKAQEREDDKQQLVQRIKQLQQQLIHPSNLHQKLKEERNKRQEQLEIMTNNYRQLEEEVEEMRVLLKDMRRKYKVAAKEIFELEKQHEQEKSQLASQYHKLSKQNQMNKAVLNTLFTQKQFQHLLALGVWEDDVFKLPPFYFKDKNTLAFPYETRSESENDLRKTNGFKRVTLPAKRRF